MRSKIHTYYIHTTAQHRPEPEPEPELELEPDSEPEPESEPEPGSVSHLYDPRGLLAVAVSRGALDQAAPHVLHHFGHVHHIPRVLRIRPWDLENEEIHR